MTELFVDTDSLGRPLLDYRYLKGMPYLLHAGSEYERRTKVIGRSRLEPESKVVVTDELGQRHSVPGQLVIEQLESRGVKLSLIRRFWALPITQRQIVRALAYEPVSELDYDYCLSHNVDTDEANGSLEKILLEQDDLLERQADGTLSVRDPFLLRWIKLTHARAEARVAPRSAIADDQEAAAVFSGLSEGEVALLHAIAIEPLSELDENYCEEHVLNLSEAVDALERLRAGGRLLDVDVDDRVVIRGPLMKKWVRARALAAQREQGGPGLNPEEVLDSSGQLQLAVLRGLAYDPPLILDQRWCRRHDLTASVDQVRTVVDEMGRRKPVLVRRNSGKRVVVAEREVRIFLRSNLRRARTGTYVRSLGEHAAARLAITLGREELSVLHALAWDPAPRLSEEYCRLHDIDHERSVRALGITMLDYGLIDRNPKGLLAPRDEVTADVLRRVIPRPGPRVVRDEVAGEQIDLLPALLTAAPEAATPAKASPKTASGARPRLVREQLSLVEELMAPAAAGQEVEL